MSSDLREALRSLAASPGFTAVVVLTLALAIGANATIFSVLYGVLLRPLDYDNPDRLAVLFERNAELGQETSQVSTATFLDWRARSRSFERIGAYRYRGFTLDRGGEVERVSSVQVSPALLQLLGVPAEIGRTFTDAEESPGHERLIVLSHGAWMRRFGGDPAILGATIRLDDAPHEVVGVMPASFQFPAGDRDVEMWSPLTVDLTALQTRPHRMYNAVGRLKAGTSLAEARRDMDGVAAGIAREFPDVQNGWGVSIVPLHEQVVGDIRRTLWVLFGAVTLVLLIACANIANVVLARSSRTARDFAVRAAFGAGRLALLRRSLVESAVLAAAGGAAGLALAYWGSTTLARLVPANVPRAAAIGLDPAVLAFTALVTIGAGVLFGLVPALRAMRPNVASVLQESGRGAGMSAASRRLSDVMVVAEVALALMLLIGAGLLLKSFVGLTAVDPGFRTSRVVAADIVLPDSRYRPSAARREFYATLIDRVRALPGIEAAGAVSVLPMSPLGNDFDLSFTIDGLEATSPSERPRAAYRGVLPGYFEAIGMTIRKGRSFDGFDGRDNGPRVTIVNESLARRYFSGVDPIDRMIKMPMAGDLRIVGVVADARTEGLQAAPEAEVFVPYYQLAIAEMQIVVLTDLDAGETGKRIRSAIAGIDPALPIAKVSAIEDLLAESVAQPRFNMALLVGLAVCAAALAAVGVYGVVAYSVSRRTSEIGLRMALGADAGSTFAMIVRNTMKVVAAGIVLGLIGAAVMGRSLESLLFGVSFLDASTYATAGLAVAALAALAASLPALRASRIDPVSALRIG